MSAHLLARVGDERFAFALARVLEALDAPPLHDAPRRPEGMLGTLHHRGQTLPVWDSARAFGVPRGAGDGTALVLGEAGHHLALMVDDALDVVDIEPKGGNYPTYLRARYRQGKPQMVERRRFVCDRPVAW